MPVVGIGGVFFRARDPDALSAWYREHLGVGAGCVATEGTTPEEWSWQTEGGPVVFAPFEATTDYFAADKQFMLNLRRARSRRAAPPARRIWHRVHDQAGMERPAVGQFARIHDPEGNAIELWEPPAQSSTPP
jgi:catechol 2,3-dioxygenase-like lactoylglutathione lyase family enzyme